MVRPSILHCYTYLQLRRFSSNTVPETIPPSRDALQLHCQRAHYQALVWNSAHHAEQELPSPAELGWRIDDAGNICPQLTTLPTMVDECIPLITCSCKGNCSTKRCSCRKAGLECTLACHPKQDHCLNGTVSS